MLRPFLPAIFLLLCCLTACGTSAAAPPTPTRVPPETANLISVSSTNAVNTLASSLARAYDGSNWKAVRGLFLDGAAGSDLVQTMRQWKIGRVANLRVTPTFVQHLAGDRYVVTLRFWQDPRVAPAYEIYLVQLGSSAARVVGTTTGLGGDTPGTVRWSISRTAHFTVYHSPFEVQGSDRQYLSGLEQEWQRVQSEFHVRLPVHIVYYLYPTTALMGRLTNGACGGNLDNVGCANPFENPPTIRTSVWPTYHEPIHVYQRVMEPAPHVQYVQVAPLFVAEGMAVALEDRTADAHLSDYCSTATLVYVPLDSCAQVAVAHTSVLPLLSDHGFSRADPASAYSLAGSFARYLMLTYGYRAYGTFYYDLAAQPSDSVADYNAAAHAVYHASITALLSAWQRRLCPHGCRS